jgi:hypothetical protein
MTRKPVVILLALVVPFGLSFRADHGLRGVSWPDGLPEARSLWFRGDRGAVM